jgi:hypothetical protein
MLVRTMENDKGQIRIVAKTMMQIVKIVMQP